MSKKFNWLNTDKSEAKKHDYLKLDVMCYKTMDDVHGYYILFRKNKRYELYFIWEDNCYYGWSEYGWEYLSDKWIHQHFDFSA